MTALLGGSKMDHSDVNYSSMYMHRLAISLVVSIAVIDPAVAMHPDTQRVLICEAS